MPVLHGMSREHYAMHATQLFIDRSGVPHAHVECAHKKYPFKIDCKFFSEGRYFHVLT